MSASVVCSLGLDEFISKEKRLWKSTFGEFIGNLILNFFACGASSQPEDGSFKALSFGLGVFIAIVIVGHLSGGHINPVVTIAMLITGRVSLTRCVFYIIAQCLGAAAATSAIKAFLDEAYYNDMGHPILAENISELQGLGIEFSLGFVIVLTVFGAYDVNRPDSRYMAPLAIGLCVTLGDLGTMRYTGSGMNPAHTFGTSYATNNWDSHWIYWAGPILGGIVAALIYTQILEKPVDRPKSSIEASDEYRIHAFETEMNKIEKPEEFV